MFRKLQIKILDIQLETNEYLISHKKPKRLEQLQH